MSIPSIILNTPMYLEPASTGGYVVINKTGSPSATLKYHICRNTDLAPVANSSWTTLTYNVSISVSQGYRIYIAAVTSNTSLYESTTAYIRFNCGGCNFYGGGNIMSLLSGVSCGSSLTISTASAFQSLFQDNAYLLTPPECPATTLSTACYYSMFSGCSNLYRTMSELPATTATDSCYRNMFYNCTALTSVFRKLPATTLAANCYRAMFMYCSSLGYIPTLTATSLPAGCYYSMFNYCSSIKIYTSSSSTRYQFYIGARASSSGTVPVTTMFKGTSGDVTGAPNYSTYYYADYTASYYNSFLGTNGSLIASDTGDSYRSAYSGEWTLLSATANNNFTLYSLSFSMSQSTSIIESFNKGDGKYGYAWVKLTQSSNNPTLAAITDTNDYFKINFTDESAQGASAVLTLSNTGFTAADFPYIEYSFDKSQWERLTWSPYFSIPLPSTMYFRGINTSNQICQSTSKYFSLNPYLLGAGLLRGAASGNIMSLISYNPMGTTVGSYAFYKFFNNKTYLTSAPNITATTINGGNAYESMFEGCTNLKTCPSIYPKTNSYCCLNMFKGCTSLTQPAELNATYLGMGCYISMYENCTGIRISTTKHDEYRTAYRVPTTGIPTGYSDAGTDMFKGTGGEYTGSLAAATTYYGDWGPHIFIQGDGVECPTAGVNGELLASGLSSIQMTDGTNTYSFTAASPLLGIESNSDTTTLIPSAGRNTVIKTITLSAGTHTISDAVSGSKYYCTQQGSGTLSGQSITLATGVTNAIVYYVASKSFTADSNVPSSVKFASNATVTISGTSTSSKAISPTTKIKYRSRIGNFPYSVRATADMPSKLTINGVTPPYTTSITKGSTCVLSVVCTGDYIVEMINVINSDYTQTGEGTGNCTITLSNPTANVTVSIMVGVGT